MRLYLTCYLIILSLSLPCCGQKDKKEKKEPVSTNQSIIPEKPIGWISDFERIFTPAEVNYLDSILTRHEKETTNEIAVVTYQLDSFLGKVCFHFLFQPCSCSV